MHTTTDQKTSCPIKTVFLNYESKENKTYFQRHNRHQDVISPVYPSTSVELTRGCWWRNLTGNTAEEDTNESQSPPLNMPLEPGILSDRALGSVVRKNNKNKHTA